MCTRPWIYTIAALLSSLFAAFVVWPVFWPIIRGPFLIDDLPAIVLNRDVAAKTFLGGKNADDLWSIWTKHDFWGQDLTSSLSHQSYRPLTTTTFRWQYIRQGNNPSAFRAANIAIHSVNSFLVFWLLTRLLSSQGKSWLEIEATLFGTLFFSTNPINAESIGWSVGRAELLSAFFSIICLLWKAGMRNETQCCSLNDRRTNSARNVLRAVMSGFFVSILATLGMLCKEQGIMVAFVSVAIDSIRIAKCVTRQKRDETVDSAEGSKRNGMPMMLILSIVTTLFFFLLALGIRTHVTSGSSVSKLLSFRENPIVFQTPRYLANLSKLTAAFHSYRLILFPANLSVFHSTSDVPLASSVSDYRVAGFGAVLLTHSLIFVLSVVRAIIASPKKPNLSSRISGTEIRRHPAIVYGSLLMVLSWLPASNIFFAVGLYVAERILYNPLIGYSMLLSAGYLNLLGTFTASSRTALEQLIENRSYQRAIAWSDGDFLFRESLLASAPPGCPLNLLQLSHTALARRDFALAVQSADKAVAISPQDYKLLLASGLCRAELSNTITDSHTRAAVLTNSWENLRLAFEACQNENPAGGCWDVSLNYGKISLAISKLDYALNALLSAVQDKPNHSGTNLDLAEVLDKMGRRKEAMKYLEKALEIQPDNGRAWRKLGDIYQVQREPNAALQAYAYALEVTNENADFGAIKGGLVLDLVGRKMVLCSMAACSLQLKDPQSALKYALQAMDNGCGGLGLAVELRIRAERFLGREIHGEELVRSAINSCRQGLCVIQEDCGEVEVRIRSFLEKIAN